MDNATDTNTEIYQHNVVFTQGKIYHRFFKPLKLIKPAMEQSQHYLLYNNPVSWNLSGLSIYVDLNLVSGERERTIMTRPL